MMHERKLTRLDHYDHSAPGAFFVTTTVHNREHAFGCIIDGVMKLNDCGKIVDQQWKWLFDQYDYLQMDAYCVMPNHFHGIIWISDVQNNRDRRVAPVGNGRDRSLQQWGYDKRCVQIKIKPIHELIGAFKTTSSKLIHINANRIFRWQKSFYERVIRNDDELMRIQQYIINNPENWEHDKLK